MSMVCCVQLSWTQSMLDKQAGNGSADNSGESPVK